MICSCCPLLDALGANVGYGSWTGQLADGSVLVLCERQSHLHSLLCGALGWRPLEGSLQAMLACSQNMLEQWLLPACVILLSLPSHGAAVWLYGRLQVLCSTGAGVYHSLLLY